MMKRKKGNLECKQKVECMKCGEVLMTENKKKHVNRKHNGESIDFRFHNDSKQTKLCFATKDLNSNTTELTNKDEMERKGWNGMAIKDGTGNTDGAVPLVVSKVKNDKRIENGTENMTKTPELTIEKERTEKGWNGMVLPDGTGCKGAVPLVVSKDRNDKESKLKGQNLTTEPIVTDKENKKRKAIEVFKEREEKKRAPVKYIGETSRSGYERLKEHFKDLENISVKSHMLKSYIERHNNVELKEMKFSVKVLRSYFSAFERQIGESVYINHYLKQGIELMNSKN